jgi:hypothetical protein
MGIAATIVANVFLTRMVAAINRKRPDGDLVSPYGWTPSKMLRVFGEYRSSYPDGSLHKRMLIAIACMMICLISLAVSLQIIE